MKGVQTYSLIIVALGFALLLNAYFILHDIFSKSRSSLGALGKGEVCRDDQAAQAEPKVNPHKTLFISCGGFLE